MELSMSEIDQLRSDIKSDLIEAKNEIKDSIRENNAAIKESMKDKIDPIKENQSRHRADLDTHFNRLLSGDTERAEMRKEIEVLKIDAVKKDSDIKNIQNTVSGLDRRQTTDEVATETKELIRQNWLQKNGQKLVIAGLVLTVIIFITERLLG